MRAKVTPSNSPIVSMLSRTKNIAATVANRYIAASKNYYTFLKTSNNTSTILTIGGLLGVNAAVNSHFSEDPCDTEPQLSRFLCEYFLFGMLGGVGGIVFTATLPVSLPIATTWVLYEYARTP